MPADKALERKGKMPSAHEAFRDLMLDGDREPARVHLERLEKLGAANKGWMEPLYRTLYDLVVHTRSPLHAHTSGTTGPPRLLRIPRRDLVSSATLTGGIFGLGPGDRALHCLPCEHIAGKMMLVRALVLGLDLHLIDPRGGVLEKLRSKDRFRFAAMIPLQLHRAVLDDRARVERQFDTVLLGGGPVSAALIEDLQGLTTAVHQGYGSTETVTHVALRKLNGTDRSELYTRTGEVTFELDLRGCLIVHTPHLSVKEHVTNDLAELDGDTRFRWLGRWDNVILSGGRKIYPEQLEARTAGRLPYPHYFTSMPDDRLGQAVMLVIETSEPEEQVLGEIRDRLSGVLQPHELPRRVIAMRRFERTGSGKLRRAN